MLRRLYSSAGGFARAFEKHAIAARSEAAPKADASFAALLRDSKFVDLGDPEGKYARGRIYDVVGDDLYVDFGWKFPCVCARPRRDPHHYVVGATVRLRIRDLELSSRFLGAETDVTLLEADCKLLDVVAPPPSLGINATK